MHPEDEDDQFDNDRDEKLIEGLGEEGKKALRKERTARKEAERRAQETQQKYEEALTTLKTEKLTRYKAQYSWLEDSDLSDIDLDQWDARITRLAAIAGANGGGDAGESQEGNSSSSSTQSTTSTSTKEKEAIQRLVNRGGGSTTTTGPAVVGAKEALAKVKSGEWTDSDYRANAQLRIEQQQRQRT